MKVIFLHDIKNVAKTGDVRTVNDGYARNYLIPKKIAIQSSLSTEQLMQRNKEQAAARFKSEQAILKKKTGVIDEKSILFEVKANETGTTFGGLTKEQILSRLAREFSIDPGIIEVDLEKPLKHIGEYRIPVKISSEQRLITIVISRKHE